jgi:hypothetical protein
MSWSCCWQCACMNIFKLVFTHVAGAVWKLSGTQGCRCRVQSPRSKVLVVNEDWAPASSLRTPETRGKKVVLEDDTDAKSGGDDPRRKQISNPSDLICIKWSWFVMAAIAAFWGCKLQTYPFQWLFLSLSFVQFAFLCCSGLPFDLVFASAVSHLHGLRREAEALQISLIYTDIHDIFGVRGGIL